jgi:hypothetical protein
MNSPGQPQSTTAATVAIIPEFLLFMLVFSKEMNFDEYIVHIQDAQGLLS